ncbi:MAG: protein kinase [bacterium]
MGDLPTGATSGARQLTRERAGDVLRERYELLEELGQGGFGSVWKAQDRELGRIVAIKWLHHVTDKEGRRDEMALARFAQEAQLIAKLNHRNTVEIYDRFTDQGDPCIVMEHIEGGNLRQYLKSHGGKLKLDEAAKMIRGVAQGLACAHNSQLIHRDIKPENILLKPEDGELVPKIVDFGLARMESESELNTMGGLGTPFYMPPEQRRDAKLVDHRADIYALGKTFYYMITGDLPDTIDPDKIPSSAISDVILKCVKLSPQERFFSAGDFIEALDDALAGVSHKKEAMPAGDAAALNLCPSCAKPNPSESKFCESCGAGLTRQCPECDRQNSVHKTFCGGCGTDVAAFDKVQEGLASVKGLLAEKNWSRAIEEAEAVAGISFNRKKGLGLLAELNECGATARNAEKRIEELAHQIDKAETDGVAHETVLEMIKEYSSLEPRRNWESRVAALHTAIDDRDFEECCQRAMDAADKGQFSDAQETVLAYLTTYPDGRHADEAKTLVETELPDREARYAENQALASAEKALDAVDGSNHQKSIDKILRALAGCQQCIARYEARLQGNRLGDAIRKLTEARGEVEKELEFRSLESSVKDLILAKDYVAACLKCREFLSKNDHHKSEAATLRDKALELEENRKAAADAAARRKLRVLLYKVGACALAIALVMANVAWRNYRLGREYDHAIDSRNLQDAERLAKKRKLSAERQLLLDYLRSSDKAKYDYDRRFADISAALSVYGGDAWNRIQSKLAEAARGDLHEAPRLYAEAADEAKAVQTRYGKLITTRQHFEAKYTVDVVSTLQALAPEEAHRLSDLVESAANEKDIDRGLDLYRKADLELNQAIQIAVKQKSAEADASAARKAAESAYADVGSDKLLKNVTELREQVVSQLAEARAMYDKRDYDQAATSWQECSDLVNQISDRIREMKSRRLLFQQSLKNYEKDIPRIRKDIPDMWRQLQALTNAAELATSPEVFISKYQDALNQLERAVDVISQKDR